ncbi:hypothetical protein [Methanoregula sp.]|uniref:hypothetical protein n=1 Tax=Methanoregula sp. TaxID=2052170 RepID=UPI002611743E|nr:hypothetical protein [Methanoregula sp.]MDD5142285.1 hypothetical protein [Methanoregula sp.]
MSRPGKITGYIIPLLLIFLIIAIGVTLIVNRAGVVPPRIEVQETSLPLPSSDYSFPFGNVTISLSGSVDPAVYYGAKAAKKETVVRGNISDFTWIRETYLAMINDPAQDSFYSSLMATFRSIRSQQHLDDDEYLELMAVFVQSMPYESLSENPPKFPIETYVDKSGDCDDKSLLLAGLLSREGYNVSLFSFTPEAHMTVGVACPEGEYKGTGYAFIETTNLSFVGVPTDTFGDGKPLSSDPFVIRIGEGSIPYQRCSESLYLNSVVGLSEQRVEELSGSIDALKVEMDQYYQSRDAGNYNQRVPVYNDMLKSRLKYAEVHNYILEHRYDRKGTWEYVKKNLPEG